jgi:glycosyltransferase involved in cell wall biosynthesis
MPSEKEGWGMTALEANACGTPVVAFQVPGLRDSVVDGSSGLLVRDEQGFKEALASVLTDPRLRAQLSKGASVWASNFTWEEYAARTIAILERISAARPRQEGGSRSTGRTKGAGTG